MQNTAGKSGRMPGQLSEKYIPITSEPDIKPNTLKNRSGYKAYTNHIDDNFLNINFICNLLHKRALRPRQEFRLPVIRLIPGKISMGTDDAFVLLLKGSV